MPLQMYDPTPFGTLHRAMTTALRDQATGSPRVVVPEFVPHPWVRNGHLQTIVGRYLVGPVARLNSCYHEFEVEDGDRLSLLDSIPEGWEAGRPAAVLVHGLAGCARSPYVVRMAARLCAKGVRAVRLNLRGAGPGFGLARNVYHAGRSGDVRRAVEWVASRSPGSPIALVGYSLGASLVLKLAAEAVELPVRGFDCVLAANPPIDLAESCRYIQRPINRIYDRNFVKSIRSDVARLHAAFPDLGPVPFPKSMTLYDFDDVYTAPRNGFTGADDYYARSSAAPLVPRIEASGLVIHSLDDPFIPAEPFRKIIFPPGLALELIPGGGHLGYLSRSKWDGDHRWLDARLTAWLSERWVLN